MHVTILRVAKTIVGAIRSNRKRLLYVSCTLVGLSVFLYMACFYWPRALSFSYSSHTCFTSPTFLPEFVRQKDPTRFTAEHTAKISIGKTPLYSHTTCLRPSQPPQAKATSKLAFSLPGLPFLSKSITVQTGNHPVLRSGIPTNKPLSTQHALALKLNTADQVFSYQVTAGGKYAACRAQAATLACDIPSLALAQGVPYDLTVQRMFNGKAVEATMSKATVTTVDPLKVIQTSIVEKQTIYTVPTELTISFSGPVKSLEGVRLEAISPEGRKNIPASTSFKNELLTIKLSEPLPRSATLELTIPKATAANGSYLPQPFVLPFATSGGPKVTNISIGSTKIQPSASIVLTFDSTLGAGQDLSNFIRVEAPGAGAPTIVANGNRVTIQPPPFGHCTPFTVKVLDGLKNEHGVSGGSAWQFKSRIICQTVFSIGTSVEGRGITGYRFGDGAQKIVYVGGTHGDERSSVAIMNRWVEELELQPGRIPAHQTIVVIPQLNPDGYAANRRTNAHMVDLNRNFPSNNWKSGVTMPDKSYLANGGGTTSLSEPESSALANYILGIKPRLVLTYHAQGSIVSPNDSGDSGAIANTYADKSSVYLLSNSGSGTFFEYDTTGAFEDWLHDKHSIPALLIELKSLTSNDFSGHVNALWYTAGL